MRVVCSHATAHDKLTRRGQRTRGGTVRRQFQNNSRKRASLPRSPSTRRRAPNRQSTRSPMRSPTIDLYQEVCFAFQNLCKGWRREAAGADRFFVAMRSRTWTCRSAWMGSSIPRLMSYIRRHNRDCWTRYRAHIRLAPLSQEQRDALPHGETESAFSPKSKLKNACKRPGPGSHRTARRAGTASKSPI